ncbi:tRNA-dihydrouridine synthase B [Aidingimonas halophila]|nr:tRNA-dihydrouridine synthase B [Aidingimonas halophila]
MPAIGQHRLTNRVILAPMAGVTDRPFRQLCRRLGAGLVVSEMVTSDPSLWHTRKSRLRLDHHGEPGPRSVQIAGGDADMLARAAQLNVEHGAEIVDINMGCPAKKVCNKAAGSALLRDERLVAQILERVVAAVDVPVTLKIRTGWCANSRNGERIAKMAESSGIQALAVHGRTREQRYQGDAEYDTIAAIKSQVNIPVFANGDIDSPAKARDVLDYTGADAVMIGRGAQGNPWIFAQINYFLRHGHSAVPPSAAECRQVMHHHLAGLHEFYGDTMGMRIARKHLGWYLDKHYPATDRSKSDVDAKALKKAFNALESTAQQYRFVDELFHHDVVHSGQRMALDGISAA